MIDGLTITFSSSRIEEQNYETNQSDNENIRGYPEWCKKRNEKQKCAQYEVATKKLD
jgi:hypothetical protein